MLQKIGRTIGYSALNILTIITLISGVVFTSITANNVKSWLASSNLYNDAVYSTISSEYIESLDTGVEKSILTTGFTQAFPPSFVQKSSETIVDSTFSWLQGKTQTVEFNIDVTEPKTQFAQTLSSYAIERYNKLPACPNRSLPKSTDPLKIDCRLPAGLLNIQSEAKKYEETIKNNPNFFPGNTITSKNIDALNPDRNPYNYSQLPQAYQRISLVPFVLAALVLVIYGWWGLLSKHRRRFFTRASINILFTSMCAAVIFAFSVTSLRALQEEALKNTELAPQLKTDFLKLFDAVMATWTKNIYIAAGVLGGAALMVLTYLYFTRTKNPNSQKPNTDDALQDAKAKFQAAAKNNKETKQ